MFFFCKIGTKKPCDNKSVTIIVVFFLNSQYQFNDLLFFLEITHRFQTARPEIRSLLLQCLLPWLENMELVAANVTPATPLSYIMV